MLYIPNNCDYLKILTDDGVKNVLVIQFRNCFKSIKEKLYSKLNLRKLVEWLCTFYIFLVMASVLISCSSGSKKDSKSLN